MLNKGWWNGSEIIPEKWINECLSPCPIAPFYGYLWWLNDPRNGMFPGAPNSAFCAMGVGSQIIYIDPENELVIVARWIEKDQMSEFVRMVLASIEN
jgi:CubicO group peptidase (beta-lactamase class C family)